MMPSPVRWLQRKRTRNLDSNVHARMAQKECRRSDVMWPQLTLFCRQGILLLRLSLLQLGLVEAGHL